MNTTTLRLRAAFADNERSRPLLDGRIAPEGIELDAIALTPGEIFARQLKGAEFDVSDMSLGSLLIATSHGPTPFVAFPVFTIRRFFHTGIIVRADAGINVPADLRGKKVGVPEYQQTANVWNRGILQHEFGVHPTEMEWFMERTPETSHGGATGFIPPPGIRLTYVPVEDNIGEMLLDGRLDALLFYAFHGNEIDRSTIDVKQRPEARMLFPDPEAEGRRYFAKTGIYPINHCMVVRRSLAEEHPWVIPSLYDAFCTAQNEKARVEMPYGIRANRTVLETIATYLHEQGLTDRVVRLDEVFAPSMFDR
ncbi:MAG: PhnD/SsuA/transferrin family substrate-binding protein [Candidatus Lustribacter sp.]